MEYEIYTPIFEDCYVCLESIDNTVYRGAVLLYKCRHPICVLCCNTIKNNLRLFDKCGICRSDINKYLIRSSSWSLEYYNSTQSIYVPTKSINNNNIYRDHVQHLLAYSDVI